MLFMAALLLESISASGKTLFVEVRILKFLHMPFNKPANFNYILTRQSGF
jgi:hypothetical protein